MTDRFQTTYQSDFGPIRNYEQVSDTAELETKRNNEKDRVTDCSQGTKTDKSNRCDQSCSSNDISEIPVVTGDGITGSTYQNKSDQSSIPNLGMTCYARCIMQVLAQTKGFQTDQFFKSMVKGDSSQEENIPALGDNVLNILSELRYSGIDVGISTYMDDLNAVLKMLSKGDKTFSGKEENDAHSFLICLLDTLGDELGHGISDLFTGEMKNVFQYSCGHKDETSQLFLSLLVPLQEDTTKRRKEMVDLEDQMHGLFEKETFPGDVLSCRDTECGVKRLDLSDERKNASGVSGRTEETQKKLMLSRPPEVLILQLARFEQSSECSSKTRCTKNQRQVSIPVSMDLTYCCEDTLRKSKIVYSLYGIIAHLGSQSGGHYVAFVRHQERPVNWYHCDTHARPISESEALREAASNAYLLFYELRQ